MLKTIFRKKQFAIPIALSFLLVIVSLMPLPKLPEIRFVATDKVGHLMAFVVLVGTYLWAYSKMNGGKGSDNSVLKSSIICILIGGGIELLQHYLPVNRFGDWIDFYFDIAGILIGILVFKMIYKSKTLVMIIMLIIPGIIYSQDVQSAKDFQEELNREFADPVDSPLDSLDRIEFVELDFYPVSEDYIVEATLVKQQGANFFEFETSTDRRPEYRIWGIAYFTLQGVECSLTLYQSKKLMNTLEYGDYLFLPYGDLTNGNTTYPGGRYNNMRTVEGDTIIIDFNQSYNPYCAYSDRFSCPKVPSNNQLNLEVEAGVKKFH
jgi:hypothetical protein